MTTFTKRFIGAMSWVAVTMLANGASVVEMQATHSDAPLGLAAGATAMFAFVGMLALAQRPGGGWRISEPIMRTAIATSLVAEYTALVSMTAFHVGNTSNLPPLTQSLISSFTTVVGIVIAFYFGASAFVEGRKLSARP
jgi:hypothetical protein